MAISLIICSRKNILPQEYVENIDGTIGCNYEIILIDNSENKYSIFEAYNEGMRRAKFPTLVFLHDDIIIHTINWGKILINIFNSNLQIGLVGVAGSKLRTKIPSTWWDNKQEHLFQNIIHLDKDSKIKHELWGFKKMSSLEEVVIIDGVFIAMRKDPRICFNEKMKGFHNYDHSISLDFLSKGYRIFATKDILIEHASTGKINSTWIDSTLKFQKIYQDQLPVYIGKAPTRCDKIYTFYRFFSYCISSGHKKLAFLQWLKHIWISPFSEENRRIVKYFFNLSHLKKSFLKR